MSMPTAICATQQLANLNSDIAQAELESKRLDNEREIIAKDVSRTSRRVRYLHCAKLFRRPANSFDLWNTGVLLVGPAIFGVIFFIVANLLSNSLSLSLIAFASGLTTGAGLVAVLLYHPANSLLEPAAIASEAKLRLEKARMAENLQQGTEVHERLHRLVEERRQLLISDQLARAHLLQQNWKSMRSDEWEEYLVDVFRALGANPQRTGKCGDQGCDLIVKVGPRRIAVQAKGYYNNVSNKAVQEAVTSKAHYACDDAAVITNSRFTPGAKALARSNNCKLIGEDEFPDFVMGKFEL